MAWPFCQGSDVSALEKMKKPLARQWLKFGYPSMVVSPPYLKIWFPCTHVRLALAVLFSSKSSVLNAPPTPFVFAKRADAPHGITLEMQAHPPVFALPILKMLGKRVSSKYPCKPSEFSSNCLGIVGSYWWRYPIPTCSSSVGLIV